MPDFVTVDSDRVRIGDQSTITPGRVQLLDEGIVFGGGVPDILSSWHQAPIFLSGQIGASSASQSHYHAVMVSDPGVIVMVGTTPHFLTSGEFASMQATAEILANGELMEAIEESKDDSRHGRVRSWADIKNELGL